MGASHFSLTIGCFGQFSPTCLNEGISTDNSDGFLPTDFIPIGAPVDWTRMLDKQHPEHAASGKKMAPWCLGEACPEAIHLPEDRDILGELPPKDTKKKGRSELKTVNPLRRLESSRRNLGHHLPLLLVTPPLSTTTPNRKTIIDTPNSNRQIGQE